jgi:hypothetical protein
LPAGRISKLKHKANDKQTASISSNTNNATVNPPKPQNLSRTTSPSLFVPAFPKDTHELWTKAVFPRSTERGYYRNVEQLTKENHTWTKMNTICQIYLKTNASRFHQKNSSHNKHNVNT